MKEKRMGDFYKEEIADKNPTFPPDFFKCGLEELWEKFVAFCRKALMPIFLVISTKEDRETVLKWLAKGAETNRTFVAIGRTKSGYLFMVSKPATKMDSAT